MVHFFRVFAVVSFLARTIAIANGHDHFCDPSQSCWPNAKEWAAFNVTVSGRLMQLNVTETCAGDAWSREANASCMIWDSCRHASCSLQMPLIIPQFAVRVAHVSDVQAAVKFASRYSLRLTVKTTGHDFVGRSNAADGLLVWMHDFNQVQVVGNYSDNCSSLGPVVQVQGGAVWSDVYPVAAPKYDVVGGNSISVSVAGGYLQGGGHSVLSPSLGLAVDSVLEMQIVTVDGHILVATPCENTDLFFALRGGGGGTFGIVTSVVLRLHRSPAQVVGLDLFVPFKDLAGKPSLVLGDFLQTYISMQPTLDKCWGGYLLTGYPGLPPGFFLHILCNAEWATAATSIAPLSKWFEEARLRHPLAGIFMKLTNKSSFWDWHGKVPDAVGGSATLASRILPQENFINPSKAGRLAATLLKYATLMSEDFAHGFYIVHLGGAVATSDPNGTAAISPAYRNGQWHVIFQASSYNAGGEESALKAVAAFQNELFLQAPSSGAYLNEMMYNEPNWQHSFFGPNYERLLIIKNRYDPRHMLTCHHCVGSELPSSVII